MHERMQMCLKALRKTMTTQPLHIESLGQPLQVTFITSLRIHVSLFITLTAKYKQMNIKLKINHMLVCNTHIKLYII